jgi:hypothetical protein
MKVVLCTIEEIARDSCETQIARSLHLDTTTSSSTTPPSTPFDYNTLQARSTMTASEVRVDWVGQDVSQHAPHVPSRRSLPVGDFFNSTTSLEIAHVLTMEIQSTDPE